MLTNSTAGWSAGPTPSGLVLERLPNGELAWLRPELDAAIRDADQLNQALTRLLGWPEPQPKPEPRYWLTQKGADLLARERAMAALFDPCWPTVAEACVEVGA